MWIHLIIFLIYVCVFIINLYIMYFCMKNYIILLGTYSGWPYCAWLIAVCQCQWSNTCSPKLNCSSYLVAGLCSVVHENMLSIKHYQHTTFSQVCYLSVSWFATGSSLLHLNYVFIHTQPLCTNLEEITRFVFTTRSYPHQHVKRVWVKIFILSIH